ncbi:MAG: transposase [Candidatus Poribacteria bacterium]|nr:transposase [Candidatus Poribacteria bacterium]
MTTLNVSEKRLPLLSDYCQFLLASFHNFTQTYFAEHTDRWSHDQLNRLLREERISAGDLWRSVKNDIEFDPDGYLIFDDTVVAKPYAKAIQSVRRQWSGSEKRVITGIGIVTCRYVNPKTQAYWIIDYRIYDSDRDGKTKLQHLVDMLRNAPFVKRLAFRRVLMDTWYASMKVMKAIEALSKVSYAPVKRSRLVSTSVASGYQRVEALTWTASEVPTGKLVHIRKFPKDHQVKVFRIASASGRTAYIVTNDLSQCDVEATHETCRLPWKIEQLHRELKQPQGSVSVSVASIVPNAIILPIVSGSR